MDRRLTPANGRVAAAHLAGLVEAEVFVEGWQRRVARPLVDLCRTPGGRRERQLLLGDAVMVYEEQGGFAFVQAAKDGYVGYVAGDALADLAEPTHWVAVPAGHVYARPDIKAGELSELVFGNAVTCVTHQPGFHETDGNGYIPKPHLWPIDKRFSDPVTVAQMFFGAPYLWGGNSVRGIDCSGLVQAGFLACGIDCPADSDLQEAALGAAVDAAAPQRRGDLIFWKRHVAIAVDEETLIHANAHHMAVAYEPAEAAIRRIEAQGEGPVISRKRI